MKIKNFAIGALAAAMLFTGTSVMEAAVYNTSASRLPTDIDSRCGRTEAFLLKNMPRNMLLPASAARAST